MDTIVKTLKETFFVEPPKELVKDFKVHVWFTNYTRAPLFALITALVVLFAGLIPDIIFAFNDYWKKNIAYLYWLQIHTMEVGSMTLFFLWFRLNPVESPAAVQPYHKVMLIGFWGCFLFLCVINTLIDQLLSGTISVYEISVVAVSSVFLMRRKTIVWLLSINHVAFLVGLFYVQPDEMEFYANSLLATIMVGVMWLISRFLYSVASINFVQSKIIQQQYHDLQNVHQTILKANENLSLLNREKDDLMSVVSHDLRNLLTYIIGMSSVMMEKKNYDPKALREYFEQMRDAGEQMMKFIQGILETGHARYGELTYSMFDVVAVTKHIISFHSDAMTQKNISLETDYPDTPALIYSDQNVVFRVLDNLISNAVKYSPTGKTVWISVSISETTARCAVRDEGQGLTDEDKSRLFQRFQRLSAKPTGGESSTGLGLSIVKELTDALGGKIWCESIYGKGATFIFETPISNCAIK